MMLIPYAIILAIIPLVILAAAAILLAGFSRRVERQSETGSRVAYRPGLWAVFIVSAVLIASARLLLLWWLTVYSFQGYDDILVIFAFFPEGMALLTGSVKTLSYSRAGLVVVLTSLLWAAGFTGLTAGLRKLRRG